MKTWRGTELEVGFLGRVNKTNSGKEKQALYLRSSRSAHGIDQQGTDLDCGQVKNDHYVENLGTKVRLLWKNNELGFELV